MTRTFDLSRSILGLKRDGKASLVPWESGPPPRVDGFIIGAPFTKGNEVICLISGRVDVVLQEDGVENIVEVTPGQAIVVPRGVWHRVLVREPGQLFHITPGPGGEWRPVRQGR